HSLISNGKSSVGLLPETMNLNVIKNPSSFYQYHSQENTEFLGLQKILPVYPESSPYYQEQPFCIVLVPKQDIISTITEFNILLIVLLLLLVLLGIVISVIFSNHYLKPISQSIELIRSSNEEEAPKTNILELDGLLSYLTDYKKQLQQKAEQDKHKISCLEQFADHAKSLTPAEHCVFQLYIQKLTAKEIAEKLCLSINTIKTHTKHIFSKLEISSREELLLYINMLEEIGYDLNTLNLSATNSIK
ncbi:MAG: helix-turn-helix transcriptional regulator, partial [Lachnospiraceae bacterium]|nr:helix-turn-helix transcriptional regulator [Lachnospiraceae bacterium]